MKGQTQEQQIKELQDRIDALSDKSLGYVTKKVAALEMFNIHKSKRILGMALIGSAFAIAIAASVNKTWGAVVAGISACGAAITLYRDTMRMSYLREHYKLAVPDPVLKAPKDVK